MKKIIITLVILLALGGLGLFIIRPGSKLSNKEKEHKLGTEKELKTEEDSQSFEADPDLFLKTYGWIEKGSEKTLVKDINNFSKDYLDVIFKQDMKNLSAYDSFNTSDGLRKKISDQGIKSYDGKFKIYTIKLEDKNTVDVTLIANVTANNKNTNNTDTKCYAPISFAAVKKDKNWVIDNFSWNDIMPASYKIIRYKDSGQIFITNKDVDTFENVLQ